MNTAKQNSKRRILTRCFIGRDFFYRVDLILATGVTPSIKSNLFPKLMYFFHFKTYKVSTSIQGVFTFY